MSVKQINQQTFLQSVADWTHQLPDGTVPVKASRPVVVDFYAVWCGPCRKLSSVLDEASAAFEGVVDFVKVDVDADAPTARAFGVRGVPTLLFLRPDGHRQRHVGYLTQAELTDWLNQGVNA